MRTCQLTVIDTKIKIKTSFVVVRNSNYSFHLFTQSTLSKLIIIVVPLRHLKNKEAIRRKYPILMETHPLNLAHQQYRRADALVKSNRYDEAIQCHHNAAELLLDAIKSTNSPVALESITMQHSYHLKQKDFLKNKKEHYVRVKQAIDNIKCLQFEQGTSS